MKTRQQRLSIPRFSLNHFALYMGLGTSLQLFVLGAHATAPEDAQWKSDSDKIAAYFQQQEMQGHMGSIIIVPVLGQNSSILAALSAHQLEFDSSHARTIFCDPNIRDKHVFLPLIRREVAAPEYDPDALSLLSELEPKEASPLVVQDMQRAMPLFPRKKTYYNFYPLCYLHLPDRSIPELTPYFHEQLQHPGDNFDYNILCMVDRYGTRDLLPDVLRIYQPHAGKWACEIEVSCLRFWIRCDPSAGIAALISSQNSRATGCYRAILFEVSNGRWDKEMQNLALKNLSDLDPEIVASAIRVLERSGDSTVEEKVVSSYVKLAEEAPHNAKIAAAIASQWTNPSSGARILMENKRFQLSNEQKRQLDAIAKLQP